MKAVSSVLLIELLMVVSNASDLSFCDTKIANENYDCFYGAGPYKDLMPWTIIGHIDTLDVVTVCFDLIIYDVQNEWTNILKISKRWTQRMPMFQLKPGGTNLYVTYSNVGHFDDGEEIGYNLPINEIHNINFTISPRAFTIKINNVTQVEMSDYPTHFVQRNLSIYACGSDNSCANVSITNLKIETYSLKSQKEQNMLTFLILTSTAIIGIVVGMIVMCYFIRTGSCLSIQEQQHEPEDEHEYTHVPYEHSHVESVDHLMELSDDITPTLNQSTTLINSEYNHEDDVVIVSTVKSTRTNDDYVII